MTITRNVGPLVVRWRSIEQKALVIPRFELYFKIVVLFYCCSYFEYVLPVLVSEDPEDDEAVEGQTDDVGQDLQEVVDAKEI